MRNLPSLFIIFAIVAGAYWFAKVITAASFMTNILFTLIIIAFLILFILGTSMAKK